MHIRTLSFLLIALLAGGLGWWASKNLLPPVQQVPEHSRAFTLFATPRTLPEFTLQQGTGEPLTLASLQGHWTIVFLGFTHCPDVCPTTLAQLAGAQKQWAALSEASRPRVLFVSADPERDSPALTMQYAQSFHPDALGATAPLPQLEAFTRSLSLVFMKSPGASGDANDYSIDHSAALVFLDPQGRMAGVAQPPLDIPGIAHDLIELTQTP